MKLLYIANVRFPIEKAHGIQIASMCEAFAKANRGLAVELIIPTRDNPDFENVDPFEYYAVERNLRITKLATADPTWLMRLWPGLYIKAQASLFIWKLHDYLSGLNLQSTILYTRDEYLLPILQRLPSANRGLTRTGTRTYADREESKGVKVVWEAHNLPTKKDYYLKYWERCHKIIAISRGLKSELIKLGIQEDKILVAPDGVDIVRFQIKDSRLKVREEMGFPSDKKIVMYTGHLYDWKGAQTLLEAARYFYNAPQPPLKLRGGEGELCFVFVGGTEHDIAKFKKQAEGADNVLILGQRPPSEIPKYLAAADILVLPNSGKFEISRSYTSPLKLFEYMAAGRPIIASDLSSIREILDENTAVFSRPDDPNDLAQKITQVLSNEKLQNRLSQNVSKKAEYYSWDSRANNIIKFIENLL